MTRTGRFGARRSQVPRRCRPLSVTGLAILAAIAIVALVPTRGNTQSADPNANANDDLLQPSLQANPNNPPAFVPGKTGTAPASQAPPAGQFTAPSRIGATPVYGSPTGFGAGDTGFDSTNTGKRKRLAQVPDNGAAIAPGETTFDAVPEVPPGPTSQPAVIAPPPPPQIYPPKAASWPGATLPPPPDQLPISN